jgi:hypothetical protein
MDRGHTMAERIPARLTPAAGRKFGVTVGLAFVVIGLIMLWRHKPIRAEVVLSVGGALVLAGLVMPTRLGPVERAWMGLAHLLSKVTTPIFMSAVYFLVLTPMGVIRRIVSGNAMLNRPRGSSRWVAHDVPPDPARMERQF